MPQFNVASLLREDGKNRVIFAWRTGSNMITIRLDIGITRGTPQHMGIEKARKAWKFYSVDKPASWKFNKETEPLDWDLIHDILPLH